MASNEKQGPDGDAAREQRSYPHGSGDRNSWSPFGKERMPIHDGGTQRHAPPEPEKQPPPEPR